MTDKRSKALRLLERLERPKPHPELQWTKAELVSEIIALRTRVAELESSASNYGWQATTKLVTK